LESAGIGVDDLNPDTFIPYRAMLAVLDRAAELTGREDFGLRLGRRQTLASLGPLGDLMACAPTLGVALADFASFQISNSTGSTVYAFRTPDELGFGYAIYDLADRASVQIHDVVLSTGCGLVSELTGGNVRPVEAWTMRPQPADARPFLSLATGPVLFGQAQTMLFFASDAADFPLPGADPAARASALGDVEKQLEMLPGGLSTEIRHAIRTLMVTGKYRLADVAAFLGYHPRTLRRRLADEDDTFLALRDNVREAVARELLSLTEVPIGDISMALGFSTHSAFDRAFRRWSGLMPSEWRKTHAATASVLRTDN
jgi:AraC-like DNA-binding protein